MRSNFFKRTVFLVGLMLTISTIFGMTVFAADYDIYVAGNGDGSESGTGWMNGYAWNPGAEANKMTVTSPNVYDIVFTNLTSGNEYQFKFTNGKWNGTDDGDDWGVEDGWTEDTATMTLSGDLYSSSKFGGRGNIAITLPENCSAVNIHFDLTNYNEETGLGATFEAKYGFAVNFNSNGGSDVKTQIVESGEHATKPSNPSKTTGGQHTFGSWYKDLELTQQFNFNNEIISGDITLYAAWTVYDYIYTYNSSNNTTGSNVCGTYNLSGFASGKSSGSFGCREGKEYTVTAVPATGYQFVEWRIGAKDGDSVGTDLEYSFVAEPAMKLYAVFEAIPVITSNVTLNTNGGTINSGNITEYIEGEGATLPNDVTREGYTFDGWYASSDFDGNPVTSISTTETRDKEYWAHWTASTYTITFDANRPTYTGTITPTSKVVTYGSTYGELATVTEIPGFTFEGWYTVDSVQDEAKIESTTIVDITEDTTLYAGWSSNTYNITVNLNSPNGVNPNFNGELNPTIKYGQFYRMALQKTPSLKGYSFIGWKDSNNNLIDLNSRYFLTEDSTVYASWEPISYTITYENLLGGTNPNTVTTYTIESDTITFEKPIRKGYAGSWDIESIESGTIGDKIITAVWKRILSGGGGLSSSKAEEETFWSKADDWAVAELKKAEKKGLIPETFKNKDFTRPITRKEFAAVAVKLYEAITKTKATPVQDNPFTDTNDEEVLKAYALGITIGTSDTTFTPNIEITREQMATMLTRALNKAEIDVTVDLNNIVLFDDDNDLSDWGRLSVYFMARKQIIKGVGDNKFNGLGNAKIEESLAIVLRSVEVFAK